MDCHPEYPEQLVLNKGCLFVRCSGEHEEDSGDEVITHPKMFAYVMREFPSMPIGPLCNRIDLNCN